jgi:hypothetical protein
MLLALAAAPPLRAIDPPPVLAAQPVLRVSPACPACGRAPAVVFPDLRTAPAAGEAPLVCLTCCPTTGHR